MGKFTTLRSPCLGSSTKLTVFLCLCIHLFYPSLLFSRKLSPASWLKCIKGDCGEQCHRFFGGGVRQLRTTQERSSCPCQMLLCADNVVPGVFGNVGHSSCTRKGFFGCFICHLKTWDILNIPLPKRRSSKIS